MEHLMRNGLSSGLGKAHVDIVLSLICRLPIDVPKATAANGSIYGKFTHFYNDDDMAIVLAYFKDHPPGQAVECELKKQLLEKYDGTHGIKYYMR
jgi:hypothetical protein